MAKENERAAAGAEEVRELLDAGPFRVKANLIIEGVDYGYSGSLGGFKHFLALLEHTLRK